MLKIYSDHWYKIIRDSDQALSRAALQPLGRLTLWGTSPPARRRAAMAPKPASHTEEASSDRGAAHRRRTGARRAGERAEQCAVDALVDGLHRAPPFQQALHTADHEPRW